MVRQTVNNRSDRCQHRGSLRDEKVCIREFTLKAWKIKTVGLGKFLTKKE